VFCRKGDRHGARSSGDEGDRTSRGEGPEKGSDHEKTGNVFLELEFE